MVWERVEGVFFPEKLFSNSITHFPLEKKKLSSYSSVVKLTFKLILLTCLTFPLFPFSLSMKHEWDNFRLIKTFQFTILVLSIWQSYLTI